MQYLFPFLTVTFIDILQILFFHSAVPDQNICPQGRYCPTGTGVPFSCPSGTFSPSFGNTALTDCQSCTPGYYCDGDLYIFTTFIQ